jgi:hypothetical protein
MGVLARREKTLSRRVRYSTRGRRVASFMGRKLRRLLDAEHRQQLGYVCRRVYNESSGWESHSHLVHLEGALNMTATQQCNALLKQHDTLHMAIGCWLLSFMSGYGKKRLCATIKHCTSRAGLDVERRNFDRVCRGLPVLCTFRRDARPLTHLAHLISVTLLSSSASEMLTKVRFHQFGEEYLVQLSERACRNRFPLEEPSIVGAIGDVRDLVLAWCMSSLSRDSFHVIACHFRTTACFGASSTSQGSPVHVITATLSSATNRIPHFLAYIVSFARQVTSST